MNYFRIYKKLIRNAQKIDNAHYYGEYHHVFPTAIFGPNNFTVFLSYREHRLAHILLYKIFERRYGLTDVRTRKLLNAVIRMKYDKQGNLISPATYELAKKYWSRSQKLEPSFKGKRHSEKTKQLISMKKSGQKLNLSEEDKVNLSNRAKANYSKSLGQKDVRAKNSARISQANKDKEWTQADRDKMSRMLKDEYASGKRQPTMKGKIPHNKIPLPPLSEIENIIEYDRQNNKRTKINKCIREAFGVSEPTASRMLKEYYKITGL